MPRLAPLLVALVALLAGCTNGDDPDVTLTPTPTGPPPPPPPPTEGSVNASVNDTWRYVGDGNETVVSAVTGVNATHVRIRSVSERVGGQPHTSITIIDARTLAIVSLQDELIGGGVVLRFTPPLPILIPAEDHEYNGTVSAATPFGDVSQPARATVRFLGLENVTVPAGDFETYRYNATIRSDGLFPVAQDWEIWFSPVAEQAVKTIRDGRAQELVSYDVS